VRFVLLTKPLSEDPCEWHLIEYEFLRLAQSQGLGLNGENSTE
jgi:hypothetical protein